MEKESINNPSFEKVHEAMPSMMDDYIVIECTSTKNPYDEDEGEHWTATIRANITDKEAAYTWLSQYESVSGCDFRVKKTKKENSKRLVFKREYMCHHNTKPRKETKPKIRKKYINRVSKHLGCQSIVRITIKQKTMHWSADDLLQDYPCEIFIRHIHNHPLKAADVLRHRRPSQEIREKFLKMFKEGHSVKSAIESHKFDLMLEHGDDYIFATGDGSKCPSNYWVYKLFHSVSVGHYGPQTGEGMIQALRDFCSKYNNEQGSECMKVQLLNERDLIIAICSPMSKRVHTLLRSAGEMMFVDSSGTMDVLNLRVFLLLTPSVAGALPLGVLIVSSESEKVLKPALALWKTLLPEKAFFGRGAAVGPKIAMTDDCAAERNSLREAFPGIILLLCIFHILQAFWRYLWKRDHNVSEKHRAEIFFVFKDLVYANDSKTFECRVEDSKKNPILLSNSQVMKHVLDYIERSEEWALFHRLDLLTRGHNTNNYSEATMRLLKDKVFNRMKAFNPVQLVDFLVTRFNTYLEMRITDVLNNRSLHTQKSRYFIRPEKTEDLITEKLPSPPDTYKVTNTKKGTKYIVIMSEEICSCPIGKSGSPCKHQFAVVRDFNIKSSQILPSQQPGPDMKLVLYEILHGHRNAPEGWFKGLREFVSHPNQAPTGGDQNGTNFPCVDDTSHSENAFPPEGDAPHVPLNNNAVQENSLSLSYTEQKMKEMFADWMKNLKERPDIYQAAFDSLTDIHAKIKTSDAALTSAIFNFGKSMGPAPLSVKKRNRSTIPVQATAKGRRKAHIEGRQAHGGGRPSKASLKVIPEHNYSNPSSCKRKEDVEPHWAHLPKKGKVAAPHSLLVCVNANRMIGSSHSKK